MLQALIKIECAFSAGDRGLGQRVRGLDDDESRGRGRSRWRHAGGPQEGARVRGHVRVQARGDQPDHAPPRRR